MKKNETTSAFDIEPIIQEIEKFTTEITNLMLSLGNITESFFENNEQYESEYLKQKKTEAASQLFQNFLQITSESLSTQIEKVEVFKRHLENFLSQSNIFCQSIAQEQLRINNLSSEILKKRAFASIQNQVDAFYSIYIVSMKV